MRKAIPFIAALTFVTGCGSSDSTQTASEASTSAETATTPTQKSTGQTSTAQAPPTSQKHTTLIGVETEYKIVPNRTTIPTGFLTLKGVNKGKIPHIFEIEGPGSENETAEIPPGKSSSIELTLRTPGNYILYCPIDDHKAKGMLTHIKVVAAG